MRHRKLYDSDPTYGRCTSFRQKTHLGPGLAPDYASGAKIPPFSPSPRGEMTNVKCNAQGLNQHAPQEVVRQRPDICSTGLPRL